jgi:hypothetical protein
VLKFLKMGLEIQQIDGTKNGETYSTGAGRRASMIPALHISTILLNESIEWTACGRLDEVESEIDQSSRCLYFLLTH